MGDTEMFSLQSPLPVELSQHAWSPYILWVVGWGVISRDLIGDRATCSAGNDAASKWQLRSMHVAICLTDASLNFPISLLLPFS
jgi:hypothetical protein